MKETPSPVVSKRELRSSHVPSVKKKVMERLRNATTGTSLTLVKSALSPRLQVESQVEAALSSQRDMVGSQRRLATFISTLDDKTVTKIPEVYNQSNVIQKSSSAAARNSSRGYLRMLSGAYRAPRSLPGGHRRSVIYLDDQKKNEDDRYDDRHLGYQTSRLLVPRTHPVAHQARPEVSTPLHLAPRLTSALERAKLSATSLTLIEEHRNINSLATYAGTAGLDPGHPHAPDIRAILPNANLPSNTRRLPPLRKMPSRIPLQKFSVPPTTASFVNFNEDTGCDEGDSTKIENGPQITGGTSTANVEAQTQKAVERQRIARAVSDELDMVTPLSPISPVDVRRVLAWSPSTGARNSPSHQRRNDVNFTQAEESNEGKRIPSAWTSVNLTSNKSIQDDHAIHPRTRSGTLRTNSARAQAKQPRSGLQIAAREAKVAWRESRMDVIFQAFHYDNESTIRTSQDISAARNADNILFGEFQQAGDEASKKSVAAMLPMRWITRVSLPQESSSEQFLLQVASVRRRLHRILSRWIEEFEKSQLVVALGLWRIAVWELSREESWVVHRVKSGCAKASSLFQTCQRRSAARAFAKLTTYAGWMMFEERSLAALKFQSAYRRLRAMRVFVWRHDAQPLGGYYADVGLGEIRESLRFRIDDRVRLERRIFWTAATSIQTRQRRNEMFGYYQHARLTATKFASLYRMHVLRRRFLLMRTSATSLEAVVRMLLMKHPYLRLRAATCVAQRMVRGHAGRMRAYSTLFARRRAIERVITAPLKIQSSWRFFIARQRVQRIRILKFREQRACLTLQLAWYRKKGSFATFLLLSCLRVSDEEDVEYAAQVQLLIRKMAARRISIRYRSHLFRRRQASAMRISSCWRAHVAKNHVLKLRKSRWALRKLHALIGVRIKAKHESASKIAIWWWSRRPGRFLRHLQYYASRYERILESEDRRTRKYAAAKIRAVVQGQSTRSWLRREGASLRLQRKWRTKLAYLNARRKREELRMVVASIVAKISMHGAIDFELNARCREFHRHAIRIQAKTRGILARQAMLLAAAVTRSRFLAATQLQRFERRRQRYVDACKQIEMARRRRGSCFKDCETFDDVFALLSKFADLPDAGQDQQNWFWYDIDNAWSGVSAHTVCRRSGHVDTLQVLGDRMISLQELSSLFSNHSPSKSTASVPPSLSQRHVASSSLEVSTLARSIIASSKKGKGGQNKIIDQCEPLTNAGDRHAAALLVCALIYDGLSHRRVESLPSPKDIGSLVKYDKLPYPCRKLVSALSDEHLFANGEAPHDVSRGMMYRFCLGYPDAEKALRALRSRHFGRLPWIPGRTEEHQDLQRVKRSYLVRLDALEHFQYFLERQDPEYARTSFLGATIASALDAANKALEIAYTRQVSGQSNVISNEALAEKTSSKFQKRKSHLGYRHNLRGFHTPQLFRRISDTNKAKEYSDQSLF